MRLFTLLCVIFSFFIPSFSSSAFTLNHILFTSRSRSLSLSYYFSFPAHFIYSNSMHYYNNFCIHEIYDIYSLLYWISRPNNVYAYNKMKMSGAVGTNSVSIYTHTYTHIHNPYITNISYWIATVSFRFWRMLKSVLCMTIISALPMNENRNGMWYALYNEIPTRYFLLGSPPKPFFAKQLWIDRNKRCKKTYI